MQEYDVSLHGDSLEKFASNFIKSRFPNYELVWKTYIGNKGNETMANIPKYPDNIKRKKFSGHSYTVLESTFMASKIIDSRIFSNHINSWDSYFNFNTKFMAFFSHIGRIRDNLIKAFDTLKLKDKVEERFKETYEARNIIMHGQTPPLSQDEFGFPQMPQFYTSIRNSNGWSDSKLWPEAALIQTKLVEDTCEKYFNDICDLVNFCYANLLDSISGELKRIGTRIDFEYIPIIRPSNISQHKQYVTVPSNSAGPASIYNIQFPTSNSLE